MSAIKNYSDQERQQSPPKKRRWRYLFILIMLGLAVHLLVPQIAPLEHSWSVVQRMHWWALALAAIAQVLSYLGSGYLLQAIMNLSGEKLSVHRGALITLASASIGLIAGGWIGGAAATYSWIHKESKDPDSAVLASALPSLFNNAASLGFAIVGIFVLILLHDLNKTQFIQFLVILFILSALASLLIGALHSPARITRVLLWLANTWSKLLHRSYNPENIQVSVSNYFKSWNSLRNKKWVRPLTGALINSLFDMLSLYFVFMAAGHDVNPEILLAGYGLPLLLGKMAFVIPGGVGVVEGSMVALYTSLKVPNEICVVVILGYRLFSFWLPTVFGFVAAAFLSRKSLSRNYS